MDDTRTVTDAKQQKIKIKKDVITSSMSTIVDRTCYVFFFIKKGLGYSNQGNIMMSGACRTYGRNKIP
jgi:hypothetical protein